MRAIEMASPMVVTADESMNLTEAAKMMRRHGVGDLVITRGDGGEIRPVGIVTDRDIVVHAIACNLNPEEIGVADLCTREPATVDGEAELADITAAMSEYGVRRLVITRNSELTGIISLDNVIEALAELMNNLRSMMARQIEYEQEHLELTNSENGSE